MAKAELGSGLLAMGRPWGKPVEKDPPSFDESQQFLNVAYNSGIRFFDTAKAYGSSEARLGNWLAGLDADMRAQVRVATKVGEFWNKKQGWKNHNYSSMRAALSRSIALFGDTLELVQVHQATKSVLQTDDIGKLAKFASDAGIPYFGASVKTVEDAKFCFDDERITHVQLPAGLFKELAQGELDNAAKNDKTILINRPFGMGSMLDEVGPEECFREILGRDYDGHLIILTGTANPDHIAENVEAFNHANSM